MDAIYLISPFYQQNKSELFGLTINGVMLQKAPDTIRLLESTSCRPCYMCTVKLDRALSGWEKIGSPCIHLVLCHPRLHTTVYFITVSTNCLIIC